MSIELRSPIGLVAGSGAFPLQFAERAKQIGLKVIAVAHRGETDKSIERLVPECSWVRLGELGKIIEQLKSRGVTQAVFAGGIRRVTTFGRMSLDSTARGMLPKLKGLTDDLLLRGIAQEFEQAGIDIVSATQVFRGGGQRGLLTERKPTADEIRDARIGWLAARAAGSVDIGQTVVVSKGVVVAVEAIEGTDKTIRRAGKLAGRGGTVVKLCKASQDLRFDLPTIGPGTIKSMKKAGASFLVIEADNSLILQQAEMIKIANRWGISIFAEKEEVGRELFA